MTEAEKFAEYAKTRQGFGGHNAPNWALGAVRDAWDAWSARAALASAPAATQGEPTREALIHAVKRMHAAKGRYHSQHATCDLYELLGLPCTREVIPTPQPTAPAERVDALCDAAYVAGAQAGFNAAASDDPDALSKLVASRSGYIEVLRATAPARAAEATQPAAAERAAEGRCLGDRCMFTTRNGLNHSRECIIEAGQTQGWTPTPEELAQAGPSQAPAGVERQPWEPYLSDRADGVRGHYAICRMHPKGYREVWSLWRHEWSSAAEDILTLEQAQALLRDAIIPTKPAGVEAAQQGQQDIAELRRLSSVCPELNLSNYGPDDVDELNGWAIEVAQCIDRAFPATTSGDGHGK
ncbi:hypothetical protein LJR039_004313 [Pseudorhodoferax sp. LjRoot39]|uniref:hypothetical protein n=1 Tax=Pseudorhodoferax sp. LjRoot39 TaxID=3342328 RepID=UPI003ECEFD3A